MELIRQNDINMILVPRKQGFFPVTMGLNVIFSKIQVQGTDYAAS